MKNYKRKKTAATLTAPVLSDVIAAGTKKEQGNVMMMQKKRNIPEMLPGYYFVYELRPDQAYGVSGIEVAVQYVKDPANGNMLGDVWIRNLDTRPDMKILAAYISTERGSTRRETELKLLREVEQSEEFAEALETYTQMLGALPLYDG